MMQELGFAARASVLASLRQGIFFMPMLVILPAFMGVDGVAVSQAATNVLTFFATLPFVRGFLKMLDTKEKSMLDPAAVKD
ncbi:MAG: hypothetical protein LIO38_04115 [Cloacibacillus sp.]|nr:hypothetical protein [Cloacibacillus sp.]